MKNIKIKNLKSREYKYYKLLYKYNLIKDCLKNNNFILFFYYDFLNPQQRKILKNKLNDQNLNTIIIKKKSSLNLLSNPEFKNLQNLINNNTLIVYDKNNNIINNKVITNLLNTKNIKLIGALWDKNLCRPSLIKKYSKLNENVKINTLLSIKSNINKLRFILTNIKK